MNDMPNKNLSNTLTLLPFSQQFQSGYEQPISYFSRKFNKHQLNYSTVEKQELGLI